MIERNYSDFIRDSIAEKTDSGWTVFIDGEKRLGAINNCEGNNEFEAKEDAWRFYQELKNNL